jgi:hypoxanthine phosphoribosyltransferase
MDVNRFNEMQEILKRAEVVYDEQAVACAVDRLAQEMSEVLKEEYPIVLSVMGGAVVFSGQLLPKLNFPLDFDYVHASRYNNQTSGGELVWKHAPKEGVRGRVVLIVDDILDEGHTLAAIKERVLDLGASLCYTAVLAEKDNGLDKPIVADFVGLTLPNRYVFGYGMDIHGGWRNLPAIYAI